MFQNYEIKRDLRNELKLTYHYILSYIYNIFIVRDNKRRVCFKNIYKADLMRLEQLERNRTCSIVIHA